MYFCFCLFRSGFTQHVSQLDEDRPYVKKPLNAFMIFRKEQRQIVMDETNIRDSASVNAIVGKKVSCLIIMLKIYSKLYES